MHIYIQIYIYIYVYMGICRGLGLYKRAELIAYQSRKNNLKFNAFYYFGFDLCLSQFP